ncbi:hypothetical protein TrRE_jg3588 [Triparma retinervis]|uniref:FAD-binding FR-type domain-containing protein n=1 Tax=Triparma retinervis TaxID=2557542 RepID=A0A9W7L6M0_9STRA|nr:hypothetical protein TrRE_jg3588 [Triparma retinervis]
MSSSLLSLVGSNHLPAAFATLVVVLFSILLSYLLPKLLGASSLTKSYAKFKVLARAVVHEGDRPIIALSLGVATKCLPTGSHVKVRVGGEGGPERSYTPTRFDGGLCELMIRVYPEGEVSPVLEKLRVGDELEMKGPTGIHRYGEDGPGTFRNGRKAIDGVRRIGMLAGGTGVTPMMQVINHIRADQEDDTETCLISYNKGEGEIMMEGELREIDREGGDKVEVKFMVSEGEGRVREGLERGSMRKMGGEELMKSMGLKGGGDEVVMICGPKGFVAKAKEELKGKKVNVLVW